MRWLLPAATMMAEVMAVIQGTTSRLRKPQSPSRMVDEVPLETQQQHRHPEEGATENDHGAT
jgi:hypothetical protein